MVKDIGFRDILIIIGLIYLIIVITGLPGSFFMVKELYDMQIEIAERKELIELTWKAVETGEYSACDAPKVEWWCEEKVAIRNSDLEFCKTRKLHDCMYRIAMNNEDLDICYEIEQLGNDPYFARLKETCIMNIAILVKDHLLCNRVVDRDGCFWGYASSLKDEEVCNFIKAADLSRSCFERVRSLISN